MSHSIQQSSPISEANWPEYFLAEQDVRPVSRELYRRTLRQFTEWVSKKHIFLSALTRADLLCYKESLIESGKSSLTVESYLTIVRMFFKWLEAKEHLPEIVGNLATIKVTAKKARFRRQPLTPEQVKNLLEYFENQSLRDRCLAHLLLRTGIRTVELCRANVEDIAFRGGKRVLKIQSKGSYEKNHFVILTEKMWKLLSKYLDSLGSVPFSAPLFASVSNNNQGMRLTTRTISQIIRRGLNAIGLHGRDFTAHSLRHTAAVSILRAGGHVEDVQGVLGHATSTTTKIYISVLKEEMRIRHAPEELIDSVY